ncbi:hypothetical protein [Pseudonocardia kongjuensis]|uniref:hypothetical protein n=1 Tax=Pseudonocardia kongjuensis TaxID=102227 RepID=UPI0031D04365
MPPGAARRIGHRPARRRVLPGDPDTATVVRTAGPGSPSSRALNLPASWAATTA